MATDTWPEHRGTKAQANTVHGKITKIYNLN